LVHFPQLKDRFATHFVPFAQFEADAADGDLPAFSFIEPCLILGRGDYHPAAARALGHGIVVPGLDPPSSILGGEAFLARIHNAYKATQSPAGSNVWNTTLLVGWDEPGGTFDHVAPGPVPPPDPSAPAGQLGFKFDRSGYWVPGHPDLTMGDRRPGIQPGAPALLPDRHAAGAVGLGDPLTGRDAAARTFTHALTPDTPRDPQHLANRRSAPGARVHPGRTRPRPDPGGIGGAVYSMRPQPDPRANFANRGRRGTGLDTRRTSGQRRKSCASPRSPEKPPAVNGAPRAETRHGGGAHSSDTIEWRPAVRPSFYEIRVAGVLPPEALLDFERLTASVQPVETVLHGPLLDQAALHGLLARLETLGVQVLEIRRLCRLDPSAGQQGPAGG
jgi:Phosphoesterase family